MTWKTHSTGSAYERVAPFSRAFYDDEWIFVAGTTGFDYATMELADDAASQVRQTWRNVEDALRAAGSHLGEIVTYLMAVPYPDDLPVIGAVMSEVLPTRPAGMAISSPLLDPRLRYEVQVTARRGVTVEP
jgi:enamine deaminase RidA (YjgF/YER057c/UK114 family)